MEMDVPGFKLRLFTAHWFTKVPLMLFMSSITKACSGLLAPRGILDHEALLGSVYPGVLPGDAGAVFGQLYVGLPRPSTVTGLSKG